MISPLAKRRLYLVAWLAAIAALSFVGGALVVQLRWWPYPRMRNALVAAEAFERKLRHPGKYGWYFYQPTRTAERGVRRYVPDEAYPGWTLYSSGHAQEAFLVDMQGTIVHRWHVPFTTAWPDAQHLDDPPPPEYVVVRAAALFGHGDLIALYRQGGGTPWGCGLVKMDKDSRVLWTYDQRTHHAAEVTADGRIVTLVHRVIGHRPVGLSSSIHPPLVEDYVVELSPDGEELERVSVTDAFRNSPYASLLRLPKSAPRGDLWHANHVEPLDPALAERFPWLRGGQVMISLRSVDTLAVVDLERATVVWATRGPWHRQHDPHFLANGNLLLFDNEGSYGPGDLSRALEIDPTSLAIRWQYTGTAADPLYTRGAGAVQRLPNGNTLITESERGRILEVTARGEVVWEYLSPFRAPHDPLLVGLVHRATRFGADELDFLTDEDPTD